MLPDGVQRTGNGRGFRPSQLGAAPPIRARSTGYFHEGPVAGAPLRSLCISMPSHLIRPLDPTDSVQQPRPQQRVSRLFHQNRSFMPNYYVSFRRLKMHTRAPELGCHEVVRRNISLPPRRTGVAGIRDAGFRLRPAVWWLASPSGCQTTQSRARADARPNNGAQLWKLR